MTQNGHRILWSCLYLPDSVMLLGANLQTPNTIILMGSKPPLPEESNRPSQSRRILLKETILDRKRFWTLVFIIILLAAVTLYFYVGIIDNWNTPVPIATPVLGSVLIILFSSPLPFIWWALRRFEYKRSFGPLVLWVVVIIALFVLDFLTAPAHG